MHDFNRENAECQEIRQVNSRENDNTCTFMTSNKLQELSPLEGR